MADNSAVRRQWDRCRHDRGRAALFETLVRAWPVIVDQELLDHRLQVAGTEDKQVVKQLPAGGKNESLRDRVRPGRPVRQPQDSHALGAEDLIEAGDELTVAVTEQELGLHSAVLELPGQVPGLLGHPLAGRTGGDAAEVDLIGEVMAIWSSTRGLWINSRRSPGLGGPGGRVEQPGILWKARLVVLFLPSRTMVEPSVDLGLES